MSDALDSYRSAWNTKPVLRLVYDDFYNRIAGICRPGTTIEIGSGIGNLKEKIGNVISTDIQCAPWLDCVMDAQSLPFAAETADNIVMVDVLHHVEYPTAFFAEADRVLRPGGRIIMVEPAITWGSSAFYRLLHHEPVVMSADPLIVGAPDPKRDPYAANQAIPTLLATRDRERFHRQFPRLRIDRVDWFSLLAYPLTGGFKPWSLVSEAIARRLLRAERTIEPLIGRALAFRMMLVVEKSDTTGD
jgi:SAM-dependent methyltransferase